MLEFDQNKKTRFFVILASVLTINAKPCQVLYVKNYIKTCFVVNFMQKKVTQGYDDEGWITDKNYQISIKY